ncbi:MAG: ThiF family adenylyltransferase [Burkholderiaceae bacterium]|nr:ThiF family adenylyltransferase [Burkholderiaceae bacterium]
MPVSDCDPRTFKTIDSNESESVFLFEDTASSRAGIQPIAQALREYKIAIVGLGGTGAYILDLVAKTHVSEIHLYDADKFRQHNAFRAPGAASRGVR